MLWILRWWQHRIGLQIDDTPLEGRGEQVYFYILCADCCVNKSEHRGEGEGLILDGGLGVWSSGKASWTQTLELDFGGRIGRELGWAEGFQPGPWLSGVKQHIVYAISSQDSSWILSLPWKTVSHRVSRYFAGNPTVRVWALRPV